LIFSAIVVEASLWAPAGARTMSVVIFGSKQGIVIIDSRKRLAAYRLFESLNVAAATRGLSQVKISPPKTAPSGFRAWRSVRTILVPSSLTGRICKARLRNRCCRVASTRLCRRTLCWAVRCRRWLAFQL
jgi:hypothetical protein